MTQYQRFSLLFLRLSLGILYFYAGITKVLDSSWSAAGYIGSAKNLTGFYQWLLSPAVLPLINFINEWGMTLLGLSLILGIFVRWSSILGAIMMLLYYLVLPFPYPDAHSFLVDEHIIYIAALLVLASLDAGRLWGLENWRSKLL